MANTLKIVTAENSNPTTCIASINTALAAMIVAAAPQQVAPISCDATVTCKADGSTPQYSISVVCQYVG